jgi:hypothetical protein
MVKQQQGNVVEAAYLGDAVYASFDGYYIWLHLGDHRSPGLIALEPVVYQRLQAYAKQIYAKQIWGDKA